MIRLRKCALYVCVRASEWYCMNARARKSNEINDCFEYVNNSNVHNAHNVFSSIQYPLFASASSII